MEITYESSTMGARAAYNKRGKLFRLPTRRGLLAPAEFAFFHLRKVESRRIFSIEMKDNVYAETTREVFVEIKS